MSEAPATKRPSWRRALLACALLLGGAVGLRLWPLPQGLLAPREGAEVRDRHGRVLVARPDGDGLRAREVKRVPPDLARMVLAAEDHRFEAHLGLDPVGIIRASWRNLRAGRVREGGSTITQQLARALRPRSPGLLGKLEEAVLAWRLEGQLDKPAILAAYLSRAWYGNGAVGAASAARTYFDVPLDSLTLAQAATLAAIPRRPADLDPFTAPRRVTAARDRVLARARQLGWIDLEREALARAEPLSLRRGDVPQEAPHYTARLLQGAHAPGAVLSGTLELALQHAAERIVREELRRLRGRGVGQAAVVVLDTPTREVLAYVGSGSWEGEAGQVDGARAERSAGSTLKPFLYALALEDPSRSLGDVLADLPGTWSTPHGNWRPHNYAEGTGGPVRMREALGRSLNLPAIRLADTVGVGRLLQRLRALGLSTLREDPAHYGLALVVGSGDVRLDALTAAYAALADGGVYRPPRFLRDAPAEAPLQVLRPWAASQVAAALDDPTARAAAFGRDSALEPDFPFAAKTGTSSGWRDNWALGANAAISVGVWVGNFDGSVMGEVGGVTGAAPILRRVAEAAMEGRSAPRFEGPPPREDPPRERLAVCPLSGMRATERCGGSVQEWVPARPPRARCDWHGPSGLRLPAAYASWAGTQGLAVQEAPSGPPRVLSPTHRSAFWLDPRTPREAQAVPLRAAATGRRARWEVDGQRITEVDAPFTARWVPTPGDHQLTVEVDGQRSDPVRVWVGTGSPPAPEP